MELEGRPIERLPESQALEKPGVWRDLNNEEEAEHHKLRQSSSATPELAE